MPSSQAITWIKVEKPSFDLIGIILSSFKLTALMLLLALAFGALLGLALILHRRRHAAPPLQAVSLHLDARP